MLQPTKRFHLFYKVCKSLSQVSRVWMDVDAISCCHQVILPPSRCLNAWSLSFWRHLVSTNGTWSAWLTDWTWLAALGLVGPKIAPKPGSSSSHSLRLACEDFIIFLPWGRIIPSSRKYWNIALKLSSLGKMLTASVNLERLIIVRSFTVSLSQPPSHLAEKKHALIVIHVWKLVIFFSWSFLWLVIFDSRSLLRHNLVHHFPGAQEWL